MDPIPAWPASCEAPGGGPQLLRASAGPCVSLTCTQTALELPGARWAPPGFFLMSLELPVLGSVWSWSCRPAAGPRAAARRWDSELTAEPSFKRTSAASPAATTEPRGRGSVSGPDPHPVCQGGSPSHSIAGPWYQQAGAHTFPLLRATSRTQRRDTGFHPVCGTEHTVPFPPCLPLQHICLGRQGLWSRPLGDLGTWRPNMGAVTGRFSRRCVHVHGVSVRACVLDFRSARAGPTPGFAPACCVAPVGQ